MKIKLRQLREQKKISQQDLAQILEISQPQYSRIENGEDNFSDEEWSKLAIFFGVKEEEIREEGSRKTYNQFFAREINGGYFAYTMNIPERLIQYNEDRIEEIKEIYEKQIQHLKEEIAFLRKQISQ